jgi:hypothetical protein
MNELRELEKEILDTAVDLHWQENKLREKRESYTKLLDLYYREQTARALDDLKKLSPHGCRNPEGCTCGKEVAQPEARQ